MNTFELQLFANPNTNTTGSAFLTPEMKTYYDTELLENAKANLVHTQFGKKVPLPSGRGKTVEWRRFRSYEKALTPLTEGVTPDGNTMEVTAITATIKQYGDYTKISDVLDATAIDPIILECTKEHGAQAGLTIDTIVRDVLHTGTNVIYASGTSRYGLTNSDVITGALCKKVATFLKKQNAKKDNGYYNVIIHPSVSEDLQNDSEWKAANTYVDHSHLLDGELGTLGGLRFFESTEAKIYRGADLCATSRNLTAGATSADDDVTVSETLVADALIGRAVLIGGSKYYVADNTTGALKLCTDPELTTPASITCNANTPVYPGEGGAAGVAVYGLLAFGVDAYGVVDPEKMGLQMIVKGLGESGDDPLNQRQSVGWKCATVAKILYQERLVRLEVGSSYGSVDIAN